MRARGDARAREGGKKGELVATFEKYFHFRAGNHRKPQGLRGVACKDRAMLEIGPKIENFEPLSE